MQGEGRGLPRGKMSPSTRADLPLELAIGTLRVADGVRFEDAAPQAVALTPPPRVARGREGEHLFILLDLTGQASPAVYGELCELVAQSYWSRSGTVTASLRQAAAAANRHLFRANLRAEPSHRCYAGLTCAVLSEGDVFILQAGPSRALVLHEGFIKRFSRAEELPPIGIGPVADVHLSHTVVAVGDALMLVSPALIPQDGDEAISRALQRPKVGDVLEDLWQLGPAVDFTALVVRWAPPSEAQVAPSAPQLPRPITPEVPAPVPEAPAPALEPPPRPKPASPPGPSLGERVQRAAHGIGRGVVAAGVWFAGAAKTLFLRMLPGPERDARRRAGTARPVPRENRAVTMAIAIGIPLVLAVLVALAYREFGADARFDAFMKRALAEVASAQAAGGVTEEARDHWSEVLDYAAVAAELQPDDPSIAALESQAQNALDQLDGVIRLNPTLLYDFGPGTVPRQLIVHERMVFVLDPGGGWVAQLALTPASDGLDDDETAAVLVHTGKQIGGAEVGDLIDLVWVGREGGRQTSSMVVLEEDGALVSYDPIWEGEEGSPQFVRSLLGTPPTGSPKNVGSFEGRFYILDSEANQIWRYQPREDLYPDPPSRYFVTSPPIPLASALDMAIDGHIYILYREGELLKFLRGERQEDFDVRGVPGDIIQAVALAVDPSGGNGAVYVADRGNGRVVVLRADGAFQAQFCAEDAFDALEAVAIDEEARRLYVVAEGKLYMAAIP